MTPAIAQSMRELEETWEAHNHALLVRRDPAASLAMMTADPSVRHIPAMTGASGRDALERFYAEGFPPHLPADLAVARDSRTVGRFRLVDEMTVSFRHDRGHYAAYTHLSQLILDEGRIGDAIALWRQAASAGHDFARRELIDLLRGHGRDDELVALLKDEPVSGAVCRQCLMSWG